MMRQTLDNLKLDLSDDDEEEEKQDEKKPAGDNSGQK